jgi:hypothetical protein
MFRSTRNGLERAWNRALETIRGRARATWCFIVGHRHPRGEHDFCDRCGPARDKDLPIPLRCRVFGHAWDGCCCRACMVTRDEHDWEGCRCRKCRSARDEQHDWDGCRCRRCREVRDEQHDWDRCECRRCGQRRDEQHEWCEHLWEAVPALRHWVTSCRRCSYTPEYGVFKQRSLDELRRLKFHI